jgi:hypothetical protein
MVHALREAHRVVTPNGVVIEMRPASVHRRVAVEQGRKSRHVGVMRENFKRERAADRAVARVVRAGWFREAPTRNFPCTRIMDTLADYATWLDEFYAVTDSPSHDWLVARIERVLEVSPRESKIVITAPVTMRLLRKRPRRRSLPE